ncbi:hypothetical protein [Flavobacterium rhizosphaerae]|uniref:Uncharacterized protein n=1 Tax=Flavobacterium rhizosphaerae TaxID=3163298 RepID=A0ABW8YWC7_9FLAO
MDSMDFMQMAATHPENNINRHKVYKKTFDELNLYLDSIQCYEKYIGFKFHNNKINFKVDTFTVDKSVYSKPFFESLEKKYKGTDTINFVKRIGQDSHGNDVEKLIFKMKVSRTPPQMGYDIYYYNISDNPTINIL